MTRHKSVGLLVPLMLGAGFACGEDGGGETDAGRADLDAAAEPDARPAPDAATGAIDAAPPPSGLVLFGGTDENNSPTNDTWTWDGETWNERSRSASPPARGAHAVALHAARGNVLLFGGADHFETGDIFGDTWAFDGNDWRKLSPADSPPAKFGHATAYDARRQRVVLFGGSQVTGATATSDTWEWNGATWRELTPAERPPERTSHALAYDAARERVVLFGGLDANLEQLDDTWVWDGERWEDVTPAERPPSRDRHALAYDAARERVVLFGGSVGFSSGDALDDTWEWDGEAWQKASPVESPTARSNHALAYDRERQQIVLFGGSGPSGRLGDTWVWDGTNWEERSPDDQPPPRASHAVAETLLP